MGTTTSTTNKDGLERKDNNNSISLLGALLDDNMPSTSSSRHVIPPKTWRKPYEYFLNREKYQTIIREEDDYTEVHHPELSNKNQIQALIQLKVLLLNLHLLQMK